MKKILLGLLSAIIIYSPVIADESHPVFGRDYTVDFVAKVYENQEAYDNEEPLEVREMSAKFLGSEISVASDAREEQPNICRYRAVEEEFRSHSPFMVDRFNFGPRLEITWYSTGMFGHRYTNYKVSLLALDQKELLFGDVIEINMIPNEPSYKQTFKYSPEYSDKILVGEYTIYQEDREVE